MGKIVKKRLRLNESALRNIIRECVMEAVSDIPAYITGRRKYYVDDYPEKSTVKAGNYDKEGYHTVITPDEYDRLSNYDDDFGYDFIEGNEEPVCYDPIDGPCYDSGEYIDRDNDMKKAYARYAHNQSDTPRSVRKYQMNADFENNRTPKSNASDFTDGTGEFNLNTYDLNGSIGMQALKGNKFAKKLRRNTPQGWVDALSGMKESKIDKIIRSTMRKHLI